MTADIASTAKPPAEIRLVDYTPPDFFINMVDLTFKLDPSATRVVSRLSICRNPAAASDAPLRLDGEAITLVMIARDGQALSADAYHQTSSGLIIPAMPDACMLELETLVSPLGNTELNGLYISGDSFFTQCEAQGFRRITYFLDRPDVMARYTVTIIADSRTCPVMLSNGNPGEVTDLENGCHRITWTDPHPKPCYLFALVAGDMASVKDQFVTSSGRRVALGIYVRHGDEDRCEHAMRSLKKAMRWDEEVFGLEYDLDVFNIAAVSDFNMGAMENKGLNIFNTKYVLARPETATDNDYQGIETVIAHEYFHNWTGNRVTCRDWFQLSLKEGLTVYRDQEFTADQGNPAVKRIGDVRVLRSTQFREDAGPFAHPVQPASYLTIDNFYTATVYNKGAEVIRMMATIIGRPAFRRGMDLYFARHDNQAVTIDDFVQAMQDASGVDLQCFKLWYHQAGTPEVSAEGTYDPLSRRYTLMVRQQTRPTPGQSVKFPLMVPIAMDLLDANGQSLGTQLAGEKEATSGTRVLLATEAENRFEFIGVETSPVPSLLRGFSAPVRLSGLSLEQLHFLAARDIDAFVKWDSGQQFAMSALLEMTQTIQSGGQPVVPSALIEVVASALDQEPAFAAITMSLPTESAIADRMEVVDPDAIHAARQKAVAEIGRTLRNRLLATYQAVADPGPYTIDGTAIGRRSLRNACLGYLVSRGDAEAIALAKMQFDNANNMTNILAALSLLSDVECPEREYALAVFYQAWRSDPLVLDKWFGIQALSSLPRTVEVVQTLQEHPDFDLRNPNRVRALIGSFAANQVRFHDPSGGGYRLYADNILALDGRNPQAAARMVSPLGQWRRFDSVRQMAMRAELQRILDRHPLSRNTFEMVSKNLA